MNATLTPPDLNTVGPRNLFELPENRKTLLRIFSKNNGDGNLSSFRTEGLGLWSTFLTKLGMDPSRFQGIQHRLLECGFLNVGFDGHEINVDLLRAEEEKARATHLNCLMVPCVRDSCVPELLHQGYISIPGFYQSLAIFDDDWESHLSRVLSSTARRNFRRQRRDLGNGYQTRWLSLPELIRDEDLFQRTLDIYDTTAQRFKHPAIHFSRKVLRALDQHSLASQYQFALTYLGDDLVKFAIFAVDSDNGYIAALVHGIDYDKVSKEHNLYNNIYHAGYERMKQLDLNVFDMGRGYVEHKKKMGANTVLPLSTYLKPLDDSARRYVEQIQAKALTIFGNQPLAQAI